MRAIGNYIMNGNETKIEKVESWSLMMGREIKEVKDIYQFIFIKWSENYDVQSYFGSLHKKRKALEKEKAERDSKPSPQSSHVPSKIGDDEPSFIHRLKTHLCIQSGRGLSRSKGLFHLRSHGVARLRSSWPTRMQSRVFMHKNT